MTQQEFEIVKALAYEETPEQIATAEGISMPDVEAIRNKFADEIDAAKATVIPTNRPIVSVSPGSS